MKKIVQKWNESAFLLDIINNIWDHFRYEIQSYSGFQALLSRVFCLCDTILTHIKFLTTDSEFTINQIQGVKTMKTQIVGFILFLCFCALVPLGVTAPSPYSLVFRSVKYPGRWKRDVYLYSQEGRDPSTRCDCVYLPPARDGFISD